MAHFSAPVDAWLLRRETWDAVTDRFAQGIQTDSDYYFVAWEYLLHVWGTVFDTRIPDAIRSDEDFEQFDSVKHPAIRIASTLMKICDGRLHSEALVEVAKDQECLSILGRRVAYICVVVRKCGAFTQRKHYGTNSTSANEL